MGRRNPDEQKVYAYYNQKKKKKRKKKSFADKEL